MSKENKREEKSIDERRLGAVASYIAASTVASVKAAALLMPDSMTVYKEQKLLETVIEILNDSH